MTSANKLAGLGVNVAAGVIGDDKCVDVGAVAPPTVPMTATIS